MSKETTTSIDTKKQATELGIIKGLQWWNKDRNYCEMKSITKYNPKRCSGYLSIDEYLKEIGHENFLVGKYTLYVIRDGITHGRECRMVLNKNIKFLLKTVEENRKNNKKIYENLD